MVDGGALVVFTHAVAILIFVVGGVFDRTGPETVQYEDDCDSVIIGGLAI